MTEDDPIVEEARRIRERLAAESGNDMRKIVAAARRRQALSGRPAVRYSPRRAPRPNADPAEGGTAPAPGRATLRASPFPGMDPWLEHPDVWPDVHFSLTTGVSAALNAALRSRGYVSRIKVRTHPFGRDDPARDWYLADP